MKNRSIAFITVQAKIQNPPTVRERCGGSVLGWGVVDHSVRDVATVDHRHREQAGLLEAEMIVAGDADGCRIINDC